MFKLLTFIPTNKAGIDKELINVSLMQILYHINIKFV